MLRAILNKSFDWYTIKEKKKKKKKIIQSSNFICGTNNQLILIYMNL